MVWKTVLALSVFLLAVLCTSFLIGLAFGTTAQLVALPFFFVTGWVFGGWMTRAIWGW